MSVIELHDTDDDTIDVENLTSKEKYIKSYLESLIALEGAIEPYMEQKRELRKEYIEKEWLFKDEIWAAVKAYRLIKKDADMEQLNEIFDFVKKVMKIV
tara:strand:+ start:1160 stop:1456 length:297 start_codon:yes stop_codon:yes gene_type:complete